MPRWLTLLLLLLLWPLPASAGASATAAADAPTSAEEWRAALERLDLANEVHIARGTDRGQADVAPRSSEAKTAASAAAFRTALLLGDRLLESPEADAIARLRRVALTYDATPPPGTPRPPVPSSTRR